MSYRTLANAQHHIQYQIYTTPSLFTTQRIASHSSAPPCYIIFIPNHPKTATFLSHPPKIYYTHSIHFHPPNATPPKRIVQYKTNLGNVRWNLIQCFVAVLCVYFFFIIFYLIFFLLFGKAV